MEKKEMIKVCKGIREAIADERKGVDEYDKLLEDIKKLPTNKGLTLFSIVQEIKAQEERHGIMLEFLKKQECK